MGKLPATAKAIRNEFTDFFSTRDHEMVSSGSLIPHDQTLLFTVAGMVQFKPYLIGEQPAPWPRAVTVQKCVRAGGKHNDLDEVGRTSRHLTFFEMMGNFSFGDYFKSEACSYAWEFVTKNLGLDAERLWVTVHESDDEAEEIWINEVGVSPDKIQRLGEDNYCTIYDVRPKACKEYPHTNRKKQNQILNLTEKNIEVCPAVYDIMEKLKKELIK